MMKLYHARGAYVASDLYPTQYGSEDCSSGYSFGPAIRNFHLIHYVYSGKGKLYTENKTYEINAGQFFIIYPHQNSYYAADTKDPWFYGWLEFDGRLAERLVSNAGFTHENHVLNDIGNVGKSLKKLIDTGWCEYSELMSMVWAFFAEMTKNNEKYNPSEHLKDYISETENYIMSRIHAPVSVSEIANYLNIDRSHLSRIFKKEKGISPKQYISALKLDIAAQNLKKSEITVKEAALSIGYTNQAEFSKAFKKRFGILPSEWRKCNTYEQSIKKYIDTT